MNRPKTTATLLVFAIALALIPASTPAQRLYNKERDEQAQAALPLAQALKTGELFDRQLKNLASLAKKDFDTEFLVTKFEIGAHTLDLLQWKDAHERVCQLERLNLDQGSIPTTNELNQALDELKKSIAEAQAALEAFKKSVKKNERDDENEDSSILATLFNNLGDLQSLADFVDDLKPANNSVVITKTLETVKQVQEIVATLKTVYDAYTAKVEEFNKLTNELADLRIVLKKVAIQSLQVDEEHWKNIASIRARREIERANVIALIHEYKGIARRLRSPSLPDGEDGLTGFCTAFRRATDVEDERQFWAYRLITDHMTEIVARAEAMERDNGQIETEAQTAIRNMSTATSEAQRRAAAQRTLDALLNAINNINADDPFHVDETKNQNMMKTRRRNLDTAITKSKSESVQALTQIAVMTRENSVRIRNMVGDIPQALFLLSTLIARGSTPSRLAEVRFAQELHAYSIRKSAVRARAYELTVSTGAQRLALFHKGGIKPTDIAELVFAASNVAITPAILAR